MSLNPIIVKESDARAIIEALNTAAKAEVIGLSDDVKVAVLPNGRTLQSIKPLLAEYLQRPERKEGTAHLTTLDSFIDHVKRFRDENSAIFADTTKGSPKLLCVFDYHEKEKGHARFGKHRGVYEFPLSDEWKAWTTTPSQMAQTSFAEFLEDRIVDVIDPSSLSDGSGIRALANQLGVALASPQKLLELSRGLTVRVGQRVLNHQNLSTGETQFSFEEAHAGDDNQPLKVPGAFAVAIPVFRGGDLYQIGVRLRYRVDRGSVNWSFVPQNVDRTIDKVIKEACDKAQSETDLPLFYGKPERKPEP